MTTTPQDEAPSFGESLLERSIAGAQAKYDRAAEEREQLNRDVGRLTQEMREASDDIEAAKADLERLRATR